MIARSRRALLEAMVAALSPVEGRRIVWATDADLADELAEVFGERGVAAFRASLDAFESGLPDARDFALDALRRSLVEPFRLGVGAGFVPAAIDPARGTWVEPRWLTGPADAVLLIDGDLRDELRDIPDAVVDDELVVSRERA